MKRHISLVVLLLVLSTYIGCPIPKTMKQETQEEDRTDSSEIEYMGQTRGEYCFGLLQDMKEAYVNRQLQTFMNYVHRNYRKDKPTLRARVQNDIKNLDFVRYDLFQDRTTTAERQGDVDVILEFHFVAQYVNRSTGDQTTVEGDATAIWRTGEEDYRLWDVRGDTFFGFSEPGVGNRPDLQPEITVINTDMIRVKVSNTGSDLAQDILVRVRDNPDDAPPNTRSDRISQLQAGSSTIVEFIPGQSGVSGVVTSEVDPNNRILEEDETNNTDRKQYE